MSPDFRQRILLPLLMPLGLLALFLAFAFSLSRVLLAAPSGSLSTFLALLVAGYLLALAGILAARPNIPTRALAVGMVVGLGALVAAGALGASAGMREVHQAGEQPAGAEGGQEGDGQAQADGEGGGDGGEGDGGATIPEDALRFVAVDIDYSKAPQSASAGEATVALDNQGSLLHDVTIEKLGETVVEAEGSKTATGTVQLEPGTYTYFCSVPGHRAAGMEGTLTVQ